MTKSLAFVGCNIGADVDREVAAHDVCWLFEPIPEVALALLDRYSGDRYRDKSIKIVNAACYSDCQPRSFNLYNRNGLSSSLGTVTQQAVDRFCGNDLSLIDTITVNCTVLSEYLPIWLDTLIIDAQGADLEILRTVHHWLDAGRIGRIKVECDGDGFRHYDGLEDNSQSALLDFMSQYQYTGYRVRGRIDDHPDWEFFRND